ncbi:hypothetical protein KUTeg_000867 [Tegillarca granosa]|uniref:protein-tyrosine-phosphatase n=1 Tax=Tegillarca granosa TaxID=220873 RepID=A0ABQ9FWG5_TEGGR|nr:hypothetical protein KUTeg_000867 [Tegillarca granosa]
MEKQHIPFTYMMLLMKNNHLTNLLKCFYERNTILTNLEEYWQYVIHIKASTNKGQSAMKTVKPEKTQPAAPGKVANFMVSRPEGNYKSATITWSIPSLHDQNSLITSYEFKQNATGTPASKILSQSVNNGDGFTESIEVQPENYYYIEVYAINNQNQTGVNSSELYYAPPGPPPKLDSSPDIKVIQNNIKNSAEETTATILLYQNQFTADENGKIINNGIILCPEKTQIPTQRQYTDYDKFTTWKKAKNDRFEQCYKPTNSSWLQNSKKVTLQKRSAHEYISYTIGEDTTCDQKPDNNYCNGPLIPGTSYKVYTFVCTKGGCSESQSITITTKGKENTLGLIGAVVGPVVAVAVIIPVVIVIIIIKRRKNNSKTGKDATYDDLQMSPYMNQGRVNGEDKTYTSLCEQNKINRYRPLNLSDFNQKVIEMHKDSDLKFAKEFQDLEMLSPKDHCQAANLQSNRGKNRDENVLPFDRSRVKFTEERDNYINASYIQNFKNKSGQDFIVTQHPLRNTIEDFWTMIWEQNVSAIIMLTPQNDGFKNSYEKYFPSEPQSSKQYGAVNVETLTKWCIQMTELSSIKLKKGKKSRMIKHFRSLGINDLYDRTMQTELFQLIDAVKSNISSTDQLGPIVVHCSDVNETLGNSFERCRIMQYIFIHDCFLHSISDNKTRQRTSLSQATGDTYEYIHVHGTN